METVLSMYYHTIELKTCHSLRMCSEEVITLLLLAFQKGHEVGKIKRKMHQRIHGWKPS
jgi:hypothetical protein